MADSIGTDKATRRHVLHLPMYVRLLLVKDWLTVPEIMGLRVTCSILLQDQVNAFVMKKFQSHGFDKHTFSTKVSARWAANSGIDFRHFSYQPKCVRPNMTPFMDACIDNEIKIVQTLLKSKSISTETLHASYASYGNHATTLSLAVHCITPYSTALHAVCLKGYTQLVEDLLNEPEALVLVLWNALDINNDTALALAIREGHVDVVQTMLLYATSQLDKLALAQEKDVHNELYSIPTTALMRAVEENHLQIVQVLLRYKYAHFDIDVNLEDDDGNIALHLAIEENNLEIVEELLSHASIDVNRVSHVSMQSPLMWAIRNDSADILHCLLEREELDFLVDGEHPLYYAAKHGFVESVRALLECSRVNDINAENAFGFTSLGTALNNGHEEAALALISDTRTDVTSSQKNLKGLTPFEYALRDSSLVSVVHALVKRSCIDVNRFSHNESKTEMTEYSTPLRTAIRYANVEAVRILLATPNIDINFRQASNGDAPLHLAAQICVAGASGKKGMRIGDTKNKNDVIYMMLLSDQRIDRLPANHGSEFPLIPSHLEEQQEEGDVR